MLSFLLSILFKQTILSTYSFNFLLNFKIITCFSWRYGFQRKEREDTTEATTYASSSSRRHTRHWRILVVKRNRGSSISGDIARMKDIPKLGNPSHMSFIILIDWFFNFPYIKDSVQGIFLLIRCECYSKDLIQYGYIEWRWPWRFSSPLLVIDWILSWVDPLWSI